jgi:hypothetical protein
LASDLDKKFQDKVQSVRSCAEETYQGQKNEGQVSWDTLPDGGPSEPGPERFLKSFRDEFNRTELGKKYTEANSKVSTGQKDVKSKVSDVLLHRTQYDWMMQVERDYLMRRRGRIRTEAHATAVREMIADPSGPIEIGIFRLAKQTLALSGVEA